MTDLCIKFENENYPLDFAELQDKDQSSKTKPKKKTTPSSKGKKPKPWQDSNRNTKTVMSHIQ